LRLCAFAGNSIGNECGGKTPASSFLCAFAGNSIATKCGAKTLFRLSFAALGLRFYGVAL